MPRRAKAFVSALLAATILASANPVLAQHLPAPGFAQDRTADFKPDPAIVFGTLPNGMRYKIQRWPTPRGEVAIRLRMAVGSLHERDDQQGLAHFLEHMAFNGSENVPESEFDKILAREGLAFGPDSNAYTSFHETVYMLDMPNAERMPLGLSMMRETAGRLLLAQDAIDRERGIIVSEERARDNPGFRQFKTWANGALAGTRIPARYPIGDMDVVRTAPRERFVDFYRSFYTPQRALLVVVGDIDPAKAKAEIERLFSDWRQPATSGADVPLTPPKAQPGAASLLVEAQAPALVRLSQPAALREAPDSAATRRTQLLEDLAHGVVNERLERIARAAGSPITAATIDAGDWVQAASMATIEASPSDPAKWRDALNIIDVELRRALTHGFTADEFAAAVAEQREAVARAAQQAGARRSNQVAMQLVQAFAEGDVATSPADDLAFFNANVTSLTPAMALAALRARWGEALPQVFVSSPAPVEGGVEAVRAAYGAARAMPASAPVAQATKAWDYTSFGTAPGQVVSRAEVAGTGVTQVRFANNVRLNVKQTSFEPGRVRVNVRFGEGQLVQPGTMPGFNFALSSGFTAGGLGRLDATDLTRTLAGRTISTSVGMDENAFIMQGATTPQDLELQMQVFAAFMTDPGWRPDGLARFKGARDAIYRQVESSPAAVWGTQGAAVLRSGDPRFAFPTPTQFDTLSLEGLRSVLEPALRSGAVEVTIVGDTSVENAIALTSRTFGALPNRAATPAPLPEARRVAFPAGRGTTTLTHKGRADQGLALVYWPIPDYGDGAQARAFRVLSAVMQNRLNEVIREQLGDTYSPGIDWQPSTVFPGFGYMGANAEVKPEDLDRVTAAIEKIAADLAKGEIDQDLFDRARRPLLADIEESRNNNPFWMTWIAGSAFDPRRLTIARDGKAHYEQVTLEQVRTLARGYLNSAKARIIHVRPGPGATPVAPAAPAAAPATPSTPR